MGITNPDMKLVWGRSGFRCAFPDCGKELANENGTIFGEMAHIVAESVKGPRDNSELNQKERNSYKNLILLCEEHHHLVDRDVVTWTVENLHVMKQRHENRVQAQLSRGSPWHFNLSTINYLN